MKCKYRYNAMMFLSMVIFISIIIYNLSHFKFIQTPSEADEKEIRMTFYTTLFGNRPWESYMPKENYKNECGYNFDRCVLNYNVSIWDDSDIVFFHARNMPPLDELEKLKKVAKVGQLWLYYVLENPYHTPPDYEKLNSLFELTGSYRSYSDFFHAYDYYDKLTEEESIDTFKLNENFSINKTKQIAWLVSHCGGLRDLLAHKFEELGLQIDVGGACGKNFKGKLECQDRACKSTLKQYKFYFSAENNLCDNYITEKYWRNPFEIDAIPITLGGSNYSDPKLAIPGSFINALDFESPKELVNYIKMVDSNDTLYKQYFQWKKYFKKRIQPSGCSKELDDFCTKLKKGLTLRKNPLLADIDIAKECTTKESYFKEWIRN